MRLLRQLPARVVALSALTLSLSACDTDTILSVLQPILNPPASLTLTPVVSGLSTPVLLTAPTADARLFIVEKGGRIRVMKNGALLTAPFLDISSAVSTTSERGLLGLAFHPQYATNGYFFVFYTDAGGDINVARYHVSANADVADANSKTTLLTVEHSSQGNHNGGMITFGTDGMLYIGIGDGGGGGDTDNNAQNKNVLLGKLLRIDVDHGSPYAIPASNPFVGQANVREEIWAYGLRNPWRYSFDREDGNLYIADVGQGSYEEVDLVADDAGGLNYGWKNMEGLHCGGGQNCSTYQAPVMEYGHTDGACSITGGYVYRGSAIPGLDGTYFYSDYCAGFLKSFRWKNGAVTEQKDWGVDGLGNVTSFGEDGAGEVYVVTEGGTIYRIDAGA